MQEEEPEAEQQTTPRSDRPVESPLGEGIEELLAAELTEVAQREPQQEEGNIPIPLPDVPEPINVDDISANPLPLPDVPEPVEGIDPEPIFREPSAGMDPDPVNRGDPESWGKWEGPGHTEPAEFRVEPGEDLATPQPIPGEGLLIEEPTVDPIRSGLELRDGLGDLGDLSVPVPDEIDPTGGEEGFEDPLDMG